MMIPTRFNPLGINRNDNLLYDGTYYYNRIEGIEFVSGSSYFITPIIPTITTRAICVAKLNDATANRVLFGSRAGSTQAKDSFAIFVNLVPNSVRLDWDGQTIPAISADGIIDRFVYNIYRVEPGAGGGLYINNVKRISISSSSSSLISTYPICVGAFSDEGYIRYPFLGVVKSFQGYAAATNLTVDWIAVERQDKSVIGFFDTVNNTFTAKLGNGIIAPVYS